MPAPKRQQKRKTKVAKPPLLVRFLPEWMQTFTARRIMDGLALAFAGAGLFLLVSLVTYDPDDPSASVAGGRSEPANWMGSAGARTADMAVQTFGASAILPGLVLVIWAVCLFRRRRIKPVSLRLTAVIAALFAGAITISRIPAPQSWPVSWAGGAVGTLLGRNLSDLLSYYVLWPVAAIICLAALIYAATLNKDEAIALGVRVKNTGLMLGARLFNMAANFIYWVRYHNTQQGEKPARPAKKPSTEKAAPARKSPQIDNPQETAGEPELPPIQETRDIQVVAPEKTGGKAKSSSSQSRLKLGQYESWDLPSLDLLQEVPEQDSAALFDKESLQKNAEMLMKVLKDFNVEGEITAIHPGPVVTLYELEPAPGTKSARVIGLSDDIARSMAAVSVRCAVVPGRNVIGIELPNKRRQTVFLRELLEARDMENTKAKLPLVLGKDIGGKPIIGDLSKMPHLLVAGTTGSGKSVAVNTMILSLIYRLPPEKCRFIMIDPKMLELSMYDDIPHLLSPVVTEPGKAVVALKWVVAEMEERYRAMSKLGVRNIEGYNQRLKEARDKGEVLMRKVQTGFDPETGKPTYEEQPLDLTELPYIVVIVDEFADLMLVAGKDVESAIQRLAQMARAAGIHMIMATQRPSVDVITGVVKANFPTRISFSVTSKIDSRTILGEGGAEQLLGQGDMLYMAGGGRINRVHGPFVSDDDVENVVNTLKAQGEPNYVDSVTDGGGEYGDNEVMNAMFSDGGGSSDVDELYDEAVAIIAREGKASTSFIQRHLQIGYNRAARIIEAMEEQGVVSKANKTGKREVLISDQSGYEDVG